MAGGISSTTLNLRFMQTAQRAETRANAPAATEKPAPKDESQWEVSAALKEAWGLDARADSSSAPAVTHEASYLPFLASTSAAVDANANAPIKGRRTWDKRGREIVPQDDVPETTPAPSAAPPKKLKSISGSGYAAPASKGKEREKAQQSVRELIGEDAGRAGGSLRAQLRGADAGGFLKPAGVDSAPAPPPKREHDAADGEAAKRKKKRKSAA